eukprot:TRINITY_DN73245_c0_g1_i1.p1 TRINITY_DN73245_c0_g1~~TRINITY_DN73245_c0_g1_i1.p1  ORF type:complete len:574 (+),score=107.84 TRINITY_DN73245_c0_g1_i1:27-1748(+)
MSVLPILCLVPLTAAHADLSWNSPNLQGKARKLWDEAALHNHIWGRCSRWDANISGCKFHSHKCTDYLSDGPPNSDIEIILSNLTASKPGNEVHLQWWAPRKSPSAWNPLTSPVGCAVYHKMNDAYPLYNASDFNGGNARVNETGEVTIRFRSPATYFVTNWISVPHVHLRICSNDAHASTRQDAIIFTKNGVELVGGEEGSSLNLKKVTSLTTSTDAPGTSTTRDAGVVGTLVFKEEGATTTVKPNAADSRQKIIDDAREDLAALEFSPIYQCFEQGQFYDAFIADCADDCTGAAVLSQGQCVRSENQAEAATLSSIWELHATCNTKCWETWRNVTLHNARLALAGQLDIPFQEVTRAALVFHGENSGGRRLSAEQKGTLQLQVSTKRLPAEEAESLMRTFLTPQSDTSEIFNFVVSQISQPTMATDGEWKEMSNGGTVVTDYMGNGNDPYQSAYKDNQPQQKGSGGDRGQSIGGIPVSGVPPEVIIIIAVVVVVAGTSFGVYLWYRKKRMLAEGATMTASGRVVGASQQNHDGKTVDDFDYPTKPAKAQADDNDYPTKPAQAQAGDNQAIP